MNGSRTDFVWNGQNLAGETKRNVTTTYTYDMTGVITSNRNGAVTRYVKDPHGNVIGTSKNNEIVGEYDYTAFGIQLQSSGGSSNPFRYCGEYYDTELDSVYLRNRYYNPSTGRFLTEDPVKDGMNWYSYCGGEPINAWDPMGLSYDEVINALSNLYYSRAIMETTPRYSVEFQDAYQYAISSKNVIRNSDVYIEDWSGLAGVLNSIVNGDNNSLERISNTKKWLFQPETYQIIRISGMMLSLRVEFL